MGLALYAVLVLLFASFVTAHVLLCLRLATTSWPKALLGLVVFPLAGYFGSKQSFSKLTRTWAICLGLYVGALLVGIVYG